MCNHQCIPDCDSAFWYSEYKVKCNCGEAEEAAATLTSPQHASDCAITLAYAKWNERMQKQDNSNLDESKFRVLDAGTF